MRVGIIGASPDRGWAMRAHIPALRALDDFELVAVGTSRPESARQAGEVFGVPLAFADASELVRHPEVELVVVTVKVSAHAELVRQAAAAGKQVYCEWPLALSADEAIELERIAGGVSAFVGLQARYSPGMAFARDEIRAGAIGRITSVRLSSTRSKGSTEAVPGWTAYTYDQAAGAGLVEVLGGHALDLVEYMAGPIGRLTGHATIQHPRHVVAETGEPIDVTAPDTFDLIGELGSGAAVSAHLHDGEAGVPATRLEISGTEGSLVVDSIPAADPSATQLQISEYAVRRDGEPLRIPDRYRTTADLLPEPASVARLYQQIATGNAPTFGAGVRIHRLLQAALTE
ncbi:Gfo/Idh/MocA family protein [Kribbella speibonae]|uniref:Gfo/Idh/MocA family oxidoreductase n=1 Tax=Kribbella speibonae TaxID=1572660 RepID=A0ABY1ZTC5_9ACTN|nr:Gfo/Idh/MocA family oxidoreductase [Kribbella speibonae]TCC16887.1 Gfo/Idh/MocA family oxidoreductase [Kribbella speibonae]